LLDGFGRQIFSQGDNACYAIGWWKNGALYGYAKRITDRTSYEGLFENDVLRQQNDKTEFKKTEHFAQQIKFSKYETPIKIANKQPDPAVEEQEKERRKKARRRKEITARFRRGVYDNSSHLLRR